MSERQEPGRWSAPETDEAETESGRVDEALREHVLAIRDRFGLAGLHAAQRLIEREIRRFDGVYDELHSDDARA